MSLGDAGDGLRVRPYAITGGRTRAATEVPDRGDRVPHPQGRAVARTPSPWSGARSSQLLATPQSAAEISARLHLPLGVARVVLGDLVDEGFVALNTRSATGRPDLRLLERVLDGLQAL